MTRSLKQILGGVALAAGMLLAPPPLQAATETPRVEFAQAQQSVAAAMEALQVRIKGQLEEAALALEDIKGKIDDAEKVDTTLADLKVEADKIAATVASSEAELQGRVGLVTKRLEALGTVPEGQVEDPTVAADRKRLQEEKAQVGGILADSEV